MTRVPRQLYRNYTELDGQSMPSQWRPWLYAPLPRRPRPLIIRWDWIMGAVLVLAVAAVMYGITAPTLLAGVR